MMGKLTTGAHTMPAGAITLWLSVRKDKALRGRSPSQAMVTNQMLHSGLLNCWKPLLTTTKWNSCEASVGTYFGFAVHSPLSEIGNLVAIAALVSLFEVMVAVLNLSRQFQL
jgi:hypothetical protein